MSSMPDDDFSTYDDDTDWDDEYDPADDEDFEDDTSDLAYEGEEPPF